MQATGFWIELSVSFLHFARDMLIWKHVHNHYTVYVKYLRPSFFYSIRSPGFFNVPKRYASHPRICYRGCWVSLLSIEDGCQGGFHLFGDLFVFNFPPTQWLRNKSFSGNLCHSCWHDRSGIDRPVTCRLWVNSAKTQKSMSRVIRIHCDAADMGKVLAEYVRAAETPKELLCCGIWGYERQAGQQRCHTGFPCQFPKTVTIGTFHGLQQLAPEAMAVLYWVKMARNYPWHKLASTCCSQRLQWWFLYLV